MGFLIALQFLTTLPAPFCRRGAAEFGPAAVDYFALVGMLLGLLLAGVDFVLSLMLPLPVVSALVVSAMVILTGGLHLDGFADTCDGLFSHTTPERRLEIMRDSRVGAFGVVGLVVLLLVKYSALISLPSSATLVWANAPWSMTRSATLVVMPTVARLVMAYSVVLFPYARAEGLGGMVQGRRRTLTLVANTVFVALLAYALLGSRGIASMSAAGIVVWLGARYVMTKIPGLTGDVYGALCELAEAVVLLVVVGGT